MYTRRKERSIAYDGKESEEENMIEERVYQKKMKKKKVCQERIVNKKVCQKKNILEEENKEEGATLGEVGAAPGEESE